jgi:hypothetical protein
MYLCKKNKVFEASSLCFDDVFSTEPLTHSCTLPDAGMKLKWGAICLRLHRAAINKKWQPVWAKKGD